MIEEAKDLYYKHYEISPSYSENNNVEKNIRKETINFI